MGIARVLLALGLPWLAASLLLAMAWPERRPGRWPFVVGHGFVLGTVATGLLLRLQGSVTGSLAPAPLLIFLALAAAAAARLAWRNRRGASPHYAHSLPAEPERAPAVWVRTLCVVLLAWLALRYAGWVVEVTQQALYPWDAWTTWAYRAKAWVLAGAPVPVVSPEAWWAEPSGKAVAVAAAQYPLLASYIVAWPALAFGGWNEPVANLPWLGLTLALGLGFYGQVRMWGGSAMAALVGVWLLASLPILGSHVALAGYFDIWMAATLGFAFIAFLRWARWRERRDAVMAVAMAAASVLLKNEGTVWVLFFVPALLAIWMGRRGWLMVLAAVAAVVALLGATGGVGIELPGVGRMALSLQRVEFPRIGVIEFGTEAGVLSAVLIHLFVFDSWHLAVYALLATFVVRATGLHDRGDPSASSQWARAGVAWVVAAVAGFLFLFFLTGASEWARRGTSVNRILLQFTPALLFWAMTVWLPVLERAHRLGATSAAGVGKDDTAQRA